MQNDKITLNDLSIFTNDGSNDVFSLLDRTATQAGKEMLRKHILNPPDTFTKLVETQDTILFLSHHLHSFPKIILNGTLVMLEKYFESAENLSAPPSGFSIFFNAYFQKLLNKRDYSIKQFTLSHLSDFLKGCKQLADIVDIENVPTLLKAHCNSIKKELKHNLTEQIININIDTKYAVLVILDYKVRREMKHIIYRLIHLYSLIDALQSMACATIEHEWVFPTLLNTNPVCFQTQGLYHPLLQNPISYDIELNKNQNFLILTGANMAGKSTFLRALGISLLLAHLGMGVPAKQMSISFTAGVITNMHIADNITKGESYFLAEVMRMKQTAEKLVAQTPHLVLMDELFKGTNVHDAYECTKAVIEGLLHQTNHLIILSTHLYEVAKLFEAVSEIQFAYFVTHFNNDDNFKFTYELKKGISNDRIGYKILQKEGVIELLKRK